MKFMCEIFPCEYAREENCSYTAIFHRLKLTFSTCGLIQTCILSVVCIVYVHCSYIQYVGIYDMCVCTYGVHKPVFIRKYFKTLSLSYGVHIYRDNEPPSRNTYVYWSIPLLRLCRSRSYIARFYRKDYGLNLNVSEYLHRKPNSLIPYKNAIHACKSTIHIITSHRHICILDTVRYPYMNTRWYAAFMK